MKNGMKISLLIIIILVSYLSCQTSQLGENYQLGGTIEPRENNNALGFFFAFDKEDGTLVGTLDFFPEMYPETERMSGLGFGVDGTLKIPFYPSKNFIAYPMIGIDSRYIYHTTIDNDNTSPKKFGIGIKFGGGLDINITPALFLRGEAFYQPKFLSFMNSYSGFRYNFGLGYRTKKDFIRINYYSIDSSGRDYDYYGGRSKKPKDKMGISGLFETIAIKDYLGQSKDIVIPTFIKGSEVRSIDPNAFSNKGLTSIVLQNIQHIGDGAFAHNQLTSVVLQNLSYIGNGAFAHNQLTSVTIGEGVKTIHANAFFDNPLHSFTIGRNIDIVPASDSFKNYDSLGFLMYASLGKKAGTYQYIDEQWQYNGKAINFPSVLKIRSYTKVTIPDVASVNSSVYTQYLLIPPGIHTIWYNYYEEHFDGSDFHFDGSDFQWREREGTIHTSSANGEFTRYFEQGKFYEINTGYDTIFLRETDDFLKEVNKF